MANTLLIRPMVSLTHMEDKKVHTFPKGIYPQVNVIAQLEFELAYNNSAVQSFNHYTMRTPLRGLELAIRINICIILLFPCVAHMNNRYSFSFFV